MPANKNALIRYKTIDRCLRNRFRRWTIDDLVDACSDALYDMEGITGGVSTRTVQADIQVMRSDKLGYNAPIEVYDNKFYRYAEDDYSIDNSPLTTEVCDLISDAVEQLKHYSSDRPQASELTHILDRVRQQLQILLL
jgi:predicted DNA-binding transcriptional regulator YafY